MEIAQIEVLLDHARGVRDLTIGVASRFTADEAYRVPPSCNNCAVWNIGHVLIVQEKLLLAAFDRKGILPARYHELFSEGSCACDWNGNRPDWDEVLSLLDPARNRVEEFLRSGVDPDTPLREPYLTQTGMVLNNLGDSLSFNTIHESIHLGVLMSYSHLLERSRP